MELATEQAGTSEKPGSAAMPAQLIPLLPKGRLDNVLYRSHAALRACAVTRAELPQIIPRQGAVVFPSHFFGYEESETCLSLLRERNLPFRVQVSPGAELLDYAEDILALHTRLPDLFLGVEIIFDRAPHRNDWRTLSSLERAGVSALFIFCPVVEINAVEAFFALPPPVRENLLFYFPKKKSRQDSFYSSDQIFLLFEKIRAQMPGFRGEIARHLQPAPKKANAAEDAFRASPTSAFFTEHHSSLGKDHWARARIFRLAENRFTASLLYLPYVLIWLVNDPLTAIRAPFRHFASLRVACFWVWDSFVALFFHTAKTLRYSLFLLRNLAQWTAQRLWLSLSFLIFHLGLPAYYSGRHLLLTLAGRIRLLLSLDPVWLVREHLPVAYWVCIYPPFKIYWFLKFQLEKRFWKRVGG